MCSREYEAALNVIDGGLTEGSRFYEPLLLIIKARLMIRSGSPSDGINLLANACGKFKRKQSAHEDPQNWIEIEQEQQSMLWKELTERYLGQDRIKDAEYSIVEMEQLAPNSPDTLAAKGDVYQAQGLTYQAIQLYETALAIDPNHSVATLSLGAS